MKSIAQAKLKKKEKKALEEFRQVLLQKFPYVEIILYGSKARGDDKEFSDIDLLVLLDDEINNSLEEEIFSTAFEIELKYDVVFGLLIESKSFWKSDLAKAMPIHWNIDREGISV
jgi:predicted nucleotidyltransferase